MCENNPLEPVAKIGLVNLCTLYSNKSNTVKRKICFRNYHKGVNVNVAFKTYEFMRDVHKHDVRLINNMCVV